MPLVKPIETAAVEALASYLQTQLSLTCRAEWPNPSRQMPLPTVTVLSAGPYEEIDFDPFVESQSTVSGNLVEYIYAVAHLTQPLQFDVWARSQPERDDITKRLRTAMRQGTKVTLGIASGDPIRHGVLLNFLSGSGWTGKVDCFLESGADLDGPSTAGSSEWRATLRGEANMWVTETAQSIKVANLRYRQRLREVGEPPYTGTFDTQVTITPTDEAWAKDVT